MRTIAHVFSSYSEATRVVQALESAGIPHSDISIVSGDKTAATTGYGTTGTGLTSSDPEQGAATGGGTGATVGTVLGGGAGLLAGAGSALGDMAIMRVMDVILAFPFILLILAVVAILGPSLWTAMIAVGIAGIPNYARLVRGEVLSVRHEDYVEAMRALGAGPLRIMFRTVLPNVVSQVVVYTSYAMPVAVLSASALSFLGLGAQPPLPEWGAMVVGGRAFLRTAWWVVAAPGLAIFIAIFSCNLLGNALRDVLDPRSAPK